MEASRSGLFGLIAVNLAVQETNVVIVTAQILDQHTEGDGVATLGHGENHRNVTFGPAQLMAGFQTGLPGPSVVSRVIMEPRSEIDRALIHLLQTVENNAKDLLRKHKYAPMKCARKKFLEDIQTGLRGLCVVSPVAMELNSVTDRAINHNLEAMEQHARDLLRKHDYVPLKCVQHQLLEGIQTGLHGLSVVSHVVMDFNNVTDHAPIRLQQTMEQLAGVLKKNHEHAPLITVTL